MASVSLHRKLGKYARGVLKLGMQHHTAGGKVVAKFEVNLLHVREVHPRELTINSRVWGEKCMNPNV